MARQIVMDLTGDARHEFDPADAVAVAEALARFKQLTDAGFTAAVRRGPGSSELVRHFDSTADETLFFPRIRPTRQMNVDELDQQGVRIAAWCFGPEGELPMTCCSPQSPAVLSEQLGRLPRLPYEPQLA